MSYVNLTKQIPADEDPFDSDKKRYEWQIEIRANMLLIDDNSPNIPIKITSNAPIDATRLKWLNKGELIAGSFLCNAATNPEEKIIVNDLDIYFKSREDALLFAKKNHLFIMGDVLKNAKTAFISQGLGHSVFNLIFGVHYETPENLISRFDIRACSIAYDPATDKLYSVVGALRDCWQKRIIFNPVPHNTTVARLVKYVEKGFTIDAYQRLFFAELISDVNYNPKLELSTGYRATNED